MYSNRQIFDNTVMPRAEIKGLQDHRHTVYFTLTNFTPGTPFLILLIISVINFIVYVLKIKIPYAHDQFSSNFKDKISLLRVAEFDNFFQFIDLDPQIENFK